MQRLANLLSHLYSLKDPIVIGHENADPDAVASAYALSKLLGTNFGFPREVSREGKILLRFLETPYELNPEINGRDVIIVDTSTREMLGGLELEKARTVTVVDHHSSKPTIEGKLFMFPDFSSTSEIVYLLFKESSNVLDEKTRLALLSGMIFDTKTLLVAKGTTVKHVAELLGNKTLQDVLDILAFDEDVTERIARLKALRKGEIIRIGDFLITYVDAGSFEGSVASILISAGADIALAYSSSSTIDRISVRLSRRAIKRGFNAVVLLDRIRGFGASCGGHAAAAGCKLPPKKAENAIEYLIDSIIEDLKEDVRAFGIRRY